MKTTSLLLILFTFFSFPAICQSLKLNKDTAKTNGLKKADQAAPASITFHLNKISGIGPQGFRTSQIGINALYKRNAPEEYAAYPQMKNKPMLDSIIEYLYILDKPQFCYQNYVAGIYSKDFFIKKLDKLKFNLADTVKLSRKPLLCYISVIAGYDSHRKPFYMVDANNNGDFSDDKLMPGIKDITTEEGMVNAGQAVDITYLFNGQIKGGTKAVTLQLAYGNTSNLGLSFAFPEYYSLVFDHKGKKYRMISQYGNSNPFFSVADESLSFSAIKSAGSIQPGQFVKLGEDVFGLANIGGNRDEVTLMGDDISGFFSTGVTYSADPNKNRKNIEGIVSRQMGFLAPAITGVNINLAAKKTGVISLEKLKGKYVFVDIWSTACGPCLTEFPFIKEAYKEFKDRNFEVIGLIDERGGLAAKPLLKQFDINWPNILIKPQTTQIKGYEDIHSYPTSFLIDPRGRIVAVDLRGNELIAALRKLIGK